MTNIYIYILLNKKNKIKRRKKKTTNKKLLKGAREIFSCRFNKKTGSNQMYPNQDVASELVVKYLNTDYCQCILCLLRIKILFFVT